MVIFKNYTRPMVAWAFYDWANSAFSTTVMAGFFPLFFKQYWSVGSDVTVSTFQLGLANSLAGVAMLFLGPILGAMADHAGRRKHFLIYFTALGALATAALYWVESGQYVLAMLIFVAASLGFSGGNNFYDALILNVTRADQSDNVSALGYALGYLGGGLLFSIHVAMVTWPALFGLADAGSAIRAAFLAVALWWAIFTLPMLLWVREIPSSSATPGWVDMWRGGWARLKSTGRALGNYRPALWFLVAYWLYIDAVDTIVRMAVDYGLAIGLDQNSLITALLMTQFIGFPATLVLGGWARRWGPKRVIYGGIAVYAVVIWMAYRMESAMEFYLLAAAIGLVQGGIQAASRSLYARLIPADQSGEFFGFFNMLGKFAVLIGPLLMGVVGVISGSSRSSILAILLLLIAGALVLTFVDDRPASRA